MTRTTIQPIKQGSYWTVLSSTSDQVYVVRQDGFFQRWVCDCPHFTYKCRKAWEYCKHIKAVLAQGN